MEPKYLGIPRCLGLSLLFFARLLGVIFLFAINPGAVKAEAPKAPQKIIGLREFAQMVAKSSPEVAIDTANINLAKEAESRTGLLADPAIALSREDVPAPEILREKNAMMPNNAAATSPSWKLSITQTFPWPGSLSAEEQMATANSGTVEVSNEAAKAERYFSALELFVEMIRNQKLLEVQESILTEANAFRDFVHERYRQGIGSHLEYLQTHTESALIETNIATQETNLENLKEHALIFLEGANNINPSNTIFSLQWPKYDDNSPNRFAPNFEEPRDHTSPIDYTLSLMKISRDKDLAAKDAMLKRSLPGISVTAMAMQSDTGMRGVGGMLGMAVPLYSMSERRALRSEITHVKAKIDADISWYEKRKELALHQSERRLDRIMKNLQSLEKDILPKVREHLEASTVYYGEGKGSVYSILDSRRKLLSLDIAKINMIAAVIRAKITISRVEYGFIDAAIDSPVPEISYATMSGGGGGAMDSGQMPGAMPSKGNKKMSPNNNNADRPQNVPSTPEMDAKPASKSGMSM